MNLSRRKLLVGMGASLIAAPAIVRVSSLMPIKALPKIIKPNRHIFESDFGILEADFNLLKILYRTDPAETPLLPQDYWDDAENYA